MIEDLWGWPLLRQLGYDPRTPLSQLPGELSGELLWRTGNDPRDLWTLLADDERLERPCRLFGVACCRRIWPLITDERSRAAVEAAERDAVSPVPLGPEYRTAGSVHVEIELRSGTESSQYWAAAAAQYAACEQAYDLPDLVATRVRPAVTPDGM